MINAVKNEIDTLANLLNFKREQARALSAKNKAILTNCQILSNDCDLICGDNLAILERLYHKKIAPIEFCYIDPPYNTRNAFIYNDTRVSNDSGNFGTHSSWMGFLLPRLVWARSLLSETGIIAVSIDDYEQPYLRLLLDRVFGEKHFLGNLVVCRSKNGRGSKKKISINHEYIVVYGKSKSSKILGSKDDPSRYNKKDEYGSYRIDGLFRKKGDASKKEDRPNMFYPLYYNSKGQVFVDDLNGKLQKKSLPLDSKGIERRWLWGIDKAREENWKLYASEKGVIYVKNYSSSTKRINVKSLWNRNAYLTERGTQQTKQIYGDKIFETPKPVELLEDLIFSHANNDATILDFFAGTGTTAHAAHNLNILDNGTRKVILIEQYEKIPPTHIASKLGFDFISQITAKRLKYISKISPEYTYSILE